MDFKSICYKITILEEACCEFSKPTVFSHRHSQPTVASKKNDDVDSNIGDTAILKKVYDFDASFRFLSHINK